MPPDGSRLGFASHLTMRGALSNASKFYIKGLSRSICRQQAAISQGPHPEVPKRSTGLEGSPPLQPCWTVRGLLRSHLTMSAVEYAAGWFEARLCLAPHHEESA